MSDMTPASARHRLPLVTSGQAQKEIVHNEALLLLDLALNAAAEAIRAIPPALPVEGQSWLVDDGATGDWTGRDGQLAGWTAGGWRFVALPEGAAVRLREGGLSAERRDGAWVAGVTRAARIEIAGAQVIGPRGAAVADPVGGETIDAEARAALSALLQRLRGHGLLDG